MHENDHSFRSKNVMGNLAVHYVVHGILTHGNLLDKITLILRNGNVLFMHILEILMHETFCTTTTAAAASTAGSSVSVKLL